MVRSENLPAAAAIVYGGEKNPLLRGTVSFYQRRSGVLVKAEISGLPAGSFFGFHIHEGSSCAGTGFSDTLGHYDPKNMPHPMHSGDLPPLLSAGGRAYMTVLSDRFSIFDIIGRTVVIHAMPDDLHTQPAGASGEKIACGEIKPINKRLKFRE